MTNDERDGESISRNGRQSKFIQFFHALFLFLLGAWGASLYIFQVYDVKTCNTCMLHEFPYYIICHATCSCAWCRAIVCVYTHTLMGVLDKKDRRTTERLQQ